MNPSVLEAREFYTHLNEYILKFGLPWDLKDTDEWKEEAIRLEDVLGVAEGRKALDCACGWGRQAIALAHLGWQVTATDTALSSLEIARQRAGRSEASLEFQVRDMRDLAYPFQEVFDCVVCCYALYDLTQDEEIQQAINGMYAALKPGGRCYLRHRNMEDVLSELPRHQFHGEKRYPGGRVICIEDWEYESETHVVQMYAFLKEDESRQDHFRWTTKTLGYQKRALRKAEFQSFLERAGFQTVEFLPQPEPWLPVEILARK